MRNDLWQFTWVVQDVSRDWPTIERETDEERGVRLRKRRLRAPVGYMSTIDKGRAVAEYTHRSAAVVTDEKEEVDEVGHGSGSCDRAWLQKKRQVGHCGWQQGHGGQSFVEFMKTIETDGRLRQLATLVTDQDLAIQAIKQDSYSGQLCDIQLWSLCHQAGGRG